MNIFLNGESVTISENSTIKSLLEEKNIQINTVVAELDGKIYNFEDFDTPLTEDCKLEILSFVGGG